MKVVHVVARMITASSGPSYTVPHLCRALMDEGVNVELHMSGLRPEMNFDIDVRTYDALPFAKNLAISPKMKRGLKEAARRADIMHSHSLWMLPNIYPGIVTRKKDGCPLVISPRGTLSDWALNRSKLKKRIVGWIGQAKVLRDAACLHATAEMESQEIRNQGLINPVTVIPNGITLPNLNDGAQRKNLKKLLFLSRIHPKKGLEMLLRVWEQIATQFDDWSLQIAGPLDNAYAIMIQELARSKQIPRVEFLGESKGLAKSKVFQDASLFVLPTESENFGVAVAEALAHGIPAIVTKGAPWRGLNTNRCGWWIDNSGRALQEALQQAMSADPESRFAMGSRGRDWMEREFSWGHIARQMIATYEWLKGERTKPDCVQLFGENRKENTCA